MENLMIVVDMLNDFVHPEGALYFPAARKIIEPIKGKIYENYRSGGSLVYLGDYHHSNDLEFEKFPPHCIEGTWGAKIIDELDYDNLLIPFHFINKARYSGFYDTHLDKYLRVFNPDMVTVVGVCTSICVMDTVGGLANRDYSVFVPTDCVADFDETMHLFSLQRMKNIYGAIVHMDQK